VTIAQQFPDAKYPVGETFEYVLDENRKRTT